MANEIERLIEVTENYNKIVSDILKQNLELYKNDPRNLPLDKLFELIEQGQLLTEPVVKRLYLDTAKSNEFYSLAGNYFYIVDAAVSSNWIKVKFNRAENDMIKFEKGFGLRRPFLRFWVTSDAQASGWVDILIGQISPQLLEIDDNRTALIQQQTLEEIRDELRGNTTPQVWGTEKTVGLSAVSIIALNTSRRGFCVQAKASNTGKIYIGFNNTVTATKWIAELQAGQAFMLDDYRGDIYAISDTAGQLLGWGEW